MIKLPNKTVFKLGLISFFTDIASEMVYPITPIFLTTVLGASMTSVGLIEGFAEALSGILKTFSGVWSDSIKRRKPFIILGYTASAFSKPLIGMSSLWLQVFSARSLDRIGKGIRTAPRDALLAESSDGKTTGAVFGWHRFMDSLGAVLGPLLALLFLTLYQDSTSLRKVFYFAGIPGLMAILIAFSVKDNTCWVENIRQSFRVQISKIWTAPKMFQRYLFAWSLFSLSNSSDVFIILKMKSEGLSLSNIILIYCGFNFIYSISSLVLGHLSDRFGRKPFVVGGFFMFSLVYFGLSQATSVWQFCMLLSTYGLYMGATDGIGKAWALDMLDKDSKATGIGVLGSMTSLWTLTAGISAGLIWDYWGSTAVFLFGAYGSLFAAIMMSYFVRTTNANN
ncbi:MAG: MFS transporter [Bdellovibrionales bacterium]|nr:MFS transporter [Bdellovibrionales bacterium]